MVIQTQQWSPHLWHTWTISSELSWSVISSFHLIWCYHLSVLLCNSVWGQLKIGTSCIFLCTSVGWYSRWYAVVCRIPRTFEQLSSISIFLAFCERTWETKYRWWLSRRNWRLFVIWQSFLLIRQNISDTADHLYPVSYHFSSFLSLDMLQQPTVSPSNHAVLSPHCNYGSQICIKHTTSV